jgi:hypothetical protein
MERTLHEAGADLPKDAANEDANMRKWPGFDGD